MVFKPVSKQQQKAMVRPRASSAPGQTHCVDINSNLLKNVSQGPTELEPKQEERKEKKIAPWGADSL